MQAPKDYQLTGIDFLSSRNRALLGDDAGLGKSLQLIRGAARLSARRIVVFCPAIGRASWKLQFAEWDEAQRPVVVLPNPALRFIPKGPLNMIVTMDYLSHKDRGATFKKMLADTEPFDVAFVDEAHYLKTPSANRTRALYGHRLDLRNAILSNIPVVWLASGTFTPLNASEMYPHLRALFPSDLAAAFGGKLPTLWEFTQRYCNTLDTPFGQKIVGNNPQTIPQLRQMIRPHFLMRLKSHVLKELPDVLSDLLPLELPKSAVKKPLSHTALSVLAADLGDDAFLDAIKQAAIADPAYSTARRDLGIAKAEAFAPVLEAYLTANPGKKAIVFAHHTSVLDQLALDATSSGFRYTMIRGDTSATARDNAVHDFQNDDGVRLFLGQIRAAGTSITLTAAQRVFILEPDPSPLNNYQAISRAHRLGQRADVHASFVFADADPIDRRSASILRRRASDFKDLFGADLPGPK